MVGKAVEEWRSRMPTPVLAEAPAQRRWFFGGGLRRGEDLLDDEGVGGGKAVNVGCGDHKFVADLRWGWRTDLP